MSSYPISNNNFFNCDEGFDCNCGPINNRGCPSNRPSNLLNISVVDVTTGDVTSRTFSNGNLQFNVDPNRLNAVVSGNGVMSFDPQFGCGNFNGFNSSNCDSRTLLFNIRPCELLSINLNNYFDQIFTTTVTDNPKFSYQFSLNNNIISYTSQTNFKGTDIINLCIRRSGFSQGQNITILITIDTRYFIPPSFSYLRLNNGIYYIENYGDASGIPALNTNINGSLSVLNGLELTSFTVDSGSSVLYIATFNSNTNTTAIYAYSYTLGRLLSIPFTNLPTTRIIDMAFSNGELYYFYYINANADITLVRSKIFGLNMANTAATPYSFIYENTEIIPNPATGPYVSINISKGNGNILLIFNDGTAYYMNVFEKNITEAIGTSTALNIVSTDPYYFTTNSLDDLIYSVTNPVNNLIIIQPGTVIQNITPNTIAGSIVSMSTGIPNIGTNYNKNFYGNI